MYHILLFEAPNGLAEALITGREKMCVWHFMQQQTYNTAALEDDVLDGYADRLAAPGALHAGIAYFRAHKIDAEHNRENAKNKLPMPVLTVSGTASAGTDFADEIRPLLAGYQTNIAVELVVRHEDGIQLPLASPSLPQTPLCLSQRDFPCTSIQALLLRQR